MKFSNIAQNSTPANTDFMVGVTAGGTDFRTPLANIAKLMYPVGSLYFNGSDSTNPGTLFGFGTWVAYAQGQVPVGFNSSDSDFSTIGATGGEKAHTLSYNEMPSHQHTGATAGAGYHDHATNTSGQTVFTAGSTQHVYGSGSGQQITWGNTRTDGNGNHAHSFTTDAAGGNAPHNNMPPYVVVYVWQRTA